MAIASGIIGGALALGSAVIGSKNASKAANAQVAAADKAAEVQKYMYDTTRADFAPWRQAGGAAITQGAAMLQPGYDHTTSPGYQFRMDEGLRGIEGSASARGLLQSGGTLKDIVRYSQGVAADDYNQQFNRQMAIAGGGQQANSTTGSLGAMAANNMGNAYMQAGNARASGYAGQSAAWGGLFDNLAGMAMGGFGG